MQLAETLVAIQQAAELVFPGEHALNGAKALVEYGFFEEGLAASFGLFSGPWVRVDIGGSCRD